MRKIGYDGTKSDLEAEQRARLAALVASIQDEADTAVGRELDSLVFEVSQALRHHVQTVRELARKENSQ
jgi:hypothetical protein